MSPDSKSYRRHINALCKQALKTDGPDPEAYTIALQEQAMWKAYRDEIRREISVQEDAMWAVYHYEQLIIRKQEDSMWAAHRSAAGVPWDLSWKTIDNEEDLMWAMYQDELHISELLNLVREVEVSSERFDPAFATARFELSRRHSRRPCPIGSSGKSSKDWRYYSRVKHSDHGKYHCKPYNHRASMKHMGFPITAEDFIF